MPRYHEPIEYDAKHNVTTVRGTTFSQQPYALEIHGAQARVWINLLNATNYFHRKANGPQPKKENQDE